MHLGASYVRKQIMKEITKHENGSGKWCIVSCRRWTIGEIEEDLRVSMSSDGGEGDERV